MKPNWYLTMTEAVMGAVLCTELGFLIGLWVA